MREYYNKPLDSKNSFAQEVDLLFYRFASRFRMLETRPHYDRNESAKDEYVGTTTKDLSKIKRSAIKKKHRKDNSSPELSSSY